MTPADVVTEAGRSVEVARGASGWLHADQGYALAVVFLVAWALTGAYMIWRTRQFDAALAQASAALDAAHKRMTEVLVTLLTHARESADDTPPPTP